MSAPWPYPFWIAHRGAGKLAPENTLAAFRLGASHGWRMFECDAKLSADGVVILLHDATLQRTTSGQGTAGDLPWSTLARLDAGSWHSRQYAGEPLPTLENVTRFCRASDWLLNIEIKPTPGTDRATGEEVARVAALCWAQAAVPPLLTSFSPKALAGARHAAPHLPRGLLLDGLPEGWLDEARSLDCGAVVNQHTQWTAETVEQTQAAGLRALSYTVNEPEAARRLVGFGIDGIITDRIDLFAPAARSA
ncbi:glycerophosphodiester phosphodiesterase [Xylophilus sp. GOD-11R]|uniref:glycerophosphodiester phosphodiesterase n=1 Tax=Xylophilus sp. GOD-11R TaxID=3089814 RepID=UPI00298C6431|nr:glycerophosphodiester phosphodiesterase [Xylophilus sp. GOD-11R]WPB55255.1 glycerophosphodiester phosphodiesterase [Xylophilus sp. GOD-11R]